MNTIRKASVGYCSTRPDERGATLVMLLAVLMPVLLIVATMTQAMTQRTRESTTSVDMQKALLAAEAGIEEANYRGSIGTLVDGVSFDVDIDGDGSVTTGPLHCTVTPTWLRADTTDNDIDGTNNEADEDVFQVIAVGTYKGAQRRLAAYLGPVPVLPSLTSAVTVTNPGVTVAIGGSALMSGADVSAAGVPTGVLRPGMNIAAPGTAAWLNSQLTGGERTKVVGSGAAPSLGTTGFIDWTTILPQMQNIASVVLSGATYSGLNVGSTATTPWTPRVAYRNGNLRIQGNSTGVGILVVNGDLEMRGNFTWYGIILVTGNVTCGSGSALVRGAILQTDSGLGVSATGNLTVQYSSACVALANSIAGRYTSFNGWQELSRQ